MQLVNLYYVLEEAILGIPVSPTPKVCECEIWFFYSVVYMNLYVYISLICIYCPAIDSVQKQSNKIQYLFEVSSGQDCENMQLRWLIGVDWSQHFSFIQALILEITICA